MPPSVSAISNVTVVPIHSDLSVVNAKWLSSTSQVTFRSCSTSVTRTLQVCRSRMW